MTKRNSIPTLALLPATAAGAPVMGGDTFPTHVAPAVEAGSALDASFLLHVPAGRRGHRIGKEITVRCPLSLGGRG